MTVNPPAPLDADRRPGSGKTLTAFLAVTTLDDLVLKGYKPAAGSCREPGGVRDIAAQGHINDIQINANPLAGITDHLQRLGLPPLAIPPPCAPAPAKAAHDARRLLSGDDTGIAVCTRKPDRSRQMLASTRTVIVDEIHAIAAGKPGQPGLEPGAPARLIAPSR